jgi:hypothetical protein
MHRLHPALPSPQTRIAHQDDASPSRSQHTRRQRNGVRWPVIAVTTTLLLMSLLSLVCALHRPETGPDLDDLIPIGANAQICGKTETRCNGGVSAGAAQPSQQSQDSSMPAPTAPACESLCARIRSVYHDPHTQALLVLLAQTPTGRNALGYLLYMGDKLGDNFISWQDLSAGHYAGFTTEGGFIELNSKMPIESDIGPYFLAGTLVHESVESYFVIAEGIRHMGTRHADYLAQWFSGKFEIELHTIPYYHAQDPWYWDGEWSSYGMSYETWINDSLDGAVYQKLPAQCDLTAADRKDHVWPPSDWWAGWGFGQGTDVSPVPNTMGLSRAMLAATDLRAFA